MAVRKPFEFLEHVSDAFAAAHGSTLEEAFENAALAMFEVMTDTSTVQPRCTNTLSVEAEDTYSLLYTWLEQLLIKFETEGFLYSKFKLDKIEKTSTGYKLTATIFGESFNPEKHPSKTAIKAVTYHQMEIAKDQEGITVKVLFDI